MAAELPNYWFVGAAAAGKDDHYNDFIEKGYWKLFWARGKQPAQETRYLRMKADDWIAIKKMVGGPLSEGKIRIRALGTIKDVSRIEPRVGVNWLLTGIDEIIDGHGFYSSIHGPFPEDHVAVQSAFRRVLGTANSQDNSSSSAFDVTELFQQPEISETTRKALIDARLGQGKFRLEVLDLWDRCCAVTGSRTCNVIRASHIKPWRNSTNEERLDPRNGIPLVATMDALFDVGLMTFATNGQMLFSSLLPDEEKVVLNLTGAKLRRKPTATTISYLKQHLAHVFRP